MKLHSTPFPFATGINFEYWFGFASSVTGNTATLFEAIGKVKTPADAKPHVWYGAATMVRTVFEKGAGGTVTQKGTRTHYYNSLASHPDSAVLQDTLLNSWKSYVKNDTQEIVFKVQLIKLFYRCTCISRQSKRSLLVGVKFCYIDIDELNGWILEA